MVPPENKKKSNGLSASFITGAIALVFLIIGYQVALFVHKAAVTRLVANRDQPDTVFVYVDTFAGEVPVSRRQEKGPMPPENPATSPTKMSSVRKNANHSPEAVAVREKASRRRVESFPFNPNTVSVEDLQRLGFSEKQAQSIDNYRQKGGRFRRPSDFAKSFVVADSVYDRLEPYIRIPRLDINQADSVALLDLPGIGPYFAGKVVQYRLQLGGYSTVEQLLEIWHFDQEKLDGMRDLITCSQPDPYAIWMLPEDALARHPHISRAEAHSIVLYRQHHSPAECTLDGLQAAGILSRDHYQRLSLCLLAPAE
jgi:DNA uptake protein ComE-like DNA-binding protein